MEFVEVHFKIGSSVYLKTDKDQLKRIVTRYTVGLYGVEKYELSCGTEATWHTPMEMSKTKNYKMA